MRTGWSIITAATATALPLLMSHAAWAQAPAALTGQVSSAKEGAMEGVVVSAKKAGGTITVSVITDDKGRYSFPAERLEPGHYTISARAVGYDLDGPKAADVAAGQATTADIKLKPTRNLTAQLTNAEWMMSMPGSDEQKTFLLNCNGCHTIERIVKSVHDPEEFEQVFQRMGSYYPGSTPLKPQRLVGDAFRDVGRRGDNLNKNAEYLASINLSQQETWGYQLKTLPRLTGKSTHVIITEYDLPDRLIQPHDVSLDRDGTVWYSDFGQMFLGKMDAKTGKVTQYPIPVVKKGYPVGTLNLEFDRDDNPWGISRSKARRSTTRCGSRTRTAATSTGSISAPTRWKTWAPSRTPAPPSGSAPTASTPTPRTTPTCSTSRPETSSRSMPRPRRRPSI
jgi:virginiamycin B lyase